MKFDIYTLSTLAIAHKAVKLADAAKIMGLDRDEITWAIEEAGRCDTDEFVAVPAGEPVPVE